MSPEERRRRRETRKYKRFVVRYGPNEPCYRAYAMQVTTGGLFLSTNSHVYAKGARILIEIVGAGQTWLATGVVRHAVKVDQSMAGFTKAGMGVELVELPPAAKEYLASL